MKQLLALVLIIAAIGCGSSNEGDGNNTKSVGTTDSNGVQTMPSGSVIQRAPNGDK